MSRDHPKPITNDVVDLPVEGMFASADWRVIGYEGENYYLACGEVVHEKVGGGATHCVKPRFHPTYSHEDFDGRTLDISPKAQTIDDQHRSRVRQLLLDTGLNVNQAFNALNAIACGGFSFRREGDK